MFYHGIKLASSFREGLDVTHDVHVAIGVASLLADAIASYRQQKCPSFDRPRDQEGDIHDGTLIFAMSMSYGALIQLLHVFAGEIHSHRQRFDIARVCARFAAEVCQVDPELVNFATWLPWYSAYEVLAWQRIPPDMEGDNYAIVAARADLDGLTDAFKKFGKHYSLDFKNNGTFRRLGTLDARSLSQIV